ncbi:hypothetical protein RclHR1_00050026 [Rhizophagus clarus]|nr:hypothetical protein RclHR1_00050026 [Rhizophagus clarus]
MNLSCPLLEVLKFHGNHPPLSILAKFIEKTEGHLRCFHLKCPDRYSNEILFKSIAKSCPKIKSLVIIFDIDKDLSLLEHLLRSCNELESLTLISLNFLYQSPLQKLLRMIDKNWKFKNEFMEYDGVQIGCGKWIEFSKSHSSHPD